MTTTKKNKCSPVPGVANATCRLDERGRPVHEACHPLADLPGVVACARVDLDGDGRPRNRIVFRREGENHEGVVTCVHSAIGTLPAGDLPAPGDARGMVEFARSTEFSPVELPPEEHFKALASYVAGVAELGVTGATRASYESDAVNPEILPFGFNAAMQKQVIKALRAVAPGETGEIVREIAGDLAGRVPGDWLESRWELLDDMYDLAPIVCRDDELFEAYGGIGNRDLVYKCSRMYEIPQVLVEKLAGNESKYVRRRIAKQNDIPENVLTKLAGDKNWEVREAIARRPDLPEDIIHILAGDDDWLIRHTIAKHPDLPPAIIRELAGDENYDVRRALAYRDDLPPDVIKELAGDKDWELRETIAGHPDLPEDVIRRLARDDNWLMRLMIAQHPDLPPDIIKELAGDENYGVRDVIAKRPDLPEDLRI